VTRALGPRVGLPSQALLPFTILILCWVPVMLAGVLWIAGRAASLVTGHGWSGPAFGFEYGLRLLVGGPGGLWPGVPVALVWALAGALLAALVAPAGALAWQVRALPGDPVPSLASAVDVAALTPRGVTERAVALRPSLRGADLRTVGPAEFGVALGELRPAGPLLRASWEDVLVGLMAPRAGKTTALAVPAILDAPGAVIATSNKADLWAATAALRGRGGERVWVFDPQAIAHAERTWWWNPLRGLATVEEAHRLASHFVQEVRGDRGDRDFWTSAAHDLLTGLLLAAGTSGRTLADVYAWLNDPVIDTPIDLLREHGHPAVASSLAGRQNGAPETPGRGVRDGPHRGAVPARSEDHGLGNAAMPPARGARGCRLRCVPADAVPTVQGRCRRGRTFSCRAH